MGREFDDFGQKRRNADECERTGSVLRAALGGGLNDCMPPLMDMLENARRNVPEALSLDLVVLPDEEMGDAKAFAVPEDQEIYIGLSFFDEALRNTPEARFDTIHELIHILFHRGAPRFFRKAAGNVVYAFLHDPHEQAEWQADRITRAIFMPPATASECKDVLQLANFASVPIRRASERFKELDAGKARPTPTDIALRMSALKREAAQATADFARLEMQERRLRLWDSLPKIENEDSAKSRQCGKYRILWNEFGKTTECGWFIENGQIVSFFASRLR